MGVIQFVFHALQLSQFPFTQLNFHGISKYMTKHQQKLDLPQSSYGYWMRVFGDSLTKYIGSLNCVHF